MSAFGSFALFAFAFLCHFHACAGVTTDAVNGVCSNANASYYFVPSLWSCSLCFSGALYSSARSQCICQSGYALTALSKCTSCAAAQQSVSLSTTTDGFQTCEPCGGSTSDAAFGLKNATWSAALQTCTCPTGYVAIDIVGSARLGAVMCAPCNEASCSTCTSPFVFSASSGTCVCGSLYTATGDGSCILTTTLSQLMSGGSGSTYSITPLNVGNSGASGTAVLNAFINLHLSTSVYRCSIGNQTACNLLANLCVISHYDISSSPCSLYLSLQSKESCKGLQCEKPTTLPWLYYLRSSASILVDDATSATLKLREDLFFLISSYSWNGTWLGNRRLTSELSLCDGPASQMQEFVEAGTNRRIACEVNLKWVAAYAETVFHELFFISNGVWYPVPVLVDNSPTDLAPDSIFSAEVQAAAASSDLTPATNGYRRRFYLTDTIGGVAIGDTQPSFVTVARRVQLLMTIKPSSSSIYSPLLIVQYQSSLTAPLFASADLSKSSPLPLLKTNTSGGYDTLSFSYSSKTTSSSDTANQALMTTLIVLSCLAFFSAWVRTYGWMRRQQSLMIGVDALGRFFFYLLNHISNVYGLVVVITSWYMFISFKYQYAIENAIADGNTYLFPMLYTAVAAKGAVIVYYIIEQTNADVFVVDWERSKGQLLRENKMAPVSLWRSAFLLNELNELQVLRRWRPLLSMLIIVLFLDGLGFIRSATSVPRATSDYDPTADTNRILRIAICAFFWVVVTLALQILEFQIYFRFFKVHPLQAFVDLCSVSNVSVMLLVEPQWGYYIHGESIHAHADVSLEEFQSNMFLESQGNLPTRGLGGQALCQTFEVFLGTYMRQFLYVKYAELAYEQQMELGGVVGQPHTGHHRRIFEFLLGMPGMTRVHTPNAINLRHQINSAFQSTVRAAEKLLLPKFGFHSWLHFPPNVMYMNGPFAGDGGQVAGKDLFFFDDSENYGSAFLYGIDFDICFFYMLLFIAIDSSLLNVYASMVITYAVDMVVVWYRGREGQANLGRKTLIDDRFFL